MHARACRTHDFGMKTGMRDITDQYTQAPIRPGVLLRRFVVPLVMICTVAAIVLPSPAAAQLPDMTNAGEAGKILRALKAWKNRDKGGLPPKKAPQRTQPKAPVTQAVPTTPPPPKPGPGKAPGFLSPDSVTISNYDPGFGLNHDETEVLLQLTEEQFERIENQRPMLDSADINKLDTVNTYFQAASWVGAGALAAAGFVSLPIAVGVGCILTFPSEATTTYIKEKNKGTHEDEAVKRSVKKATFNSIISGLTFGAVNVVMKNMAVDDAVTEMVTENQVNAFFKALGNVEPPEGQSPVFFQKFKEDYRDPLDSTRPNFFTDFKKDHPVRAPRQMDGPGIYVPLGVRG